VSTRGGYTFVPYGKLQQGRSDAPNPNELAIDVHLGTLQVVASAPTGTSLDLQLPFGALTTHTIALTRTDNGIGDLEVRLRQSNARFFTIPRVSLSATVGMVLPTGPYVAKSGAANLPPEASFLTLGRGIAWGLGELDGRVSLAKRWSVMTQLSARIPLQRTTDDFEWGPEVRGMFGVRGNMLPSASWLAASIATDFQWRGGATEPDPFNGGRFMSANAGGWQWSISPSLSAQLPMGFSLVAGLRVPLAINVTGNQLVPQIGGFTALSYSQQVTRRSSKLSTTATAKPIDGMITVIDYSATWCGPCHEIEKQLSEASVRWTDVKIVKVDASAWPDPSGPQLPAEAKGLPVVEIYGRDGKRLALLLGPDALGVVAKVDEFRLTQKPTN
jgi:thiol-disulfide isomerase/thioredoxin